MQKGDIEAAMLRMDERTRAAQMSETPGGDAIVDPRYLFGDLFDRPEADAHLRAMVESYSEDILTGVRNLPTAMYLLAQHALAVGVLAERWRWREEPNGSES